MPSPIPESTLEKFTTFGDLLRFLRRRAGITQLEFSIAVGYSDSQISRLEQNMRLPDPHMIEARFVPALFLEDEIRVVERLLELAANVRREDAPDPGLCPYKGLEYFDEVDAGLFVGREVLSARLADYVLALASNEQPGEMRFFTIVGASGSGKSSLVRAGLVPALRWSKRSANWQIHVLTPTAHPIESLATTLSQENTPVSSTTLMMDDLQRDPRCLGLYIKRELKDTGASHLLLVIDQFEELFSLCRSEDERRAFINNLLSVSCEDDSHTIIVITLRADFYAHCASYPHLREALARQQEYIGAMSDEETRRAIEEPARRGRWEFEPGLVDVILHDVGHEPGALPLLSHALLETWQRRHGRMLTLSGYLSAGGVRGAIAETAEAVFTDRFTHEQQVIARRIFLRLTELGDETSTGDTRRRASLRELILKPEEKDVIQNVIKTLADARLVTTSEDSVQVAHEALIREWPTLRGWLEDNREGLRLHRQLTEASQDWQSSERVPDLLFRGVRLAQVREWAASHEEDMNILEQEFLLASIGSAEREAVEQETAHLRELEAAQKLAELERQRAETERQRAEDQITTSRRLKSRAFVGGILGTIAALLAAVAFFAWQRSSSQADINHRLVLAYSAQELTTAGNGDLALLLAKESVNTKDPPPEAMITLQKIASGFGRRAVLRGHSMEVKAVAFSPDAKTVFSGSCSKIDNNGSCLTGELILWDIDTQKVLHRWSGHLGWVTSVAFSNNGETLISGAEDGSLIQWDIRGENPRQLLGHTAKITDLVFLPETDRLLSSSMDGSIILWDTNNSSKIKSFEIPADPSPIISIAYAPDAAIVVSAHQNGTLWLWDLNTIQPIKHFSTSALDIRSVAINRDASRIIYDDGSVKKFLISVIDGASGVVLNEKTPGCVPGELIPSPDFSNVLLACTSTVFQLETQGWMVLGNSIEPTGVPSALAMSQDGILGISGTQDGTINVWNLVVNPPTIMMDVDGYFSIANSSSDKYLLMNDAHKNGYDQPALWDIAEKKIIKTYAGFDEAVAPTAVDISPDDQLVAAAGSEIGVIKPIVAIWDIEKEEPRCKFIAFPDFSEGARAIAFSPDSKYLLVGSIVPDGITGHLILLDTQCNIVRIFDTTDEVTSVSFSADGTQAVTGTSQLGKATLWDVAKGEEIRHFSYADNGIAYNTVFGPGKTILNSGIGDLFLWDIATGNQIRRFTGVDQPFGIAISPNEKYVIAGTLKGDLILWDFATGNKLNHISINSFAIVSVVFSSDSKTVYASSQSGRLIEYHIHEQSLPELLDWIEKNRYVRPLTDAEKIQYNIES